jgi:hypothetical protein
MHEAGETTSATFAFGMINFRRRQPTLPTHRDGRPSSLHSLAKVGHHLFTRNGFCLPSCVFIHSPLDLFVPLCCDDLRSKATCPIGFAHNTLSQLLRELLSRTQRERQCRFANFLEFHILNLEKHQPFQPTVKPPAPPCLYRERSARKSSRWHASCSTRRRPRRRRSQTPRSRWRN